MPRHGDPSPHREPARLHHRPGDDWEIGGGPTDPDDPGPYGTPGWHQDRRTGRHRRGELPDPLPETTGTEAPEGFSRMQEDAYRAFLRDSEELHLAHYETAEEHRALVRLRWVLRVLLAVLYWRVLPFPERPAPRPSASRETHRIEHRAENPRGPKGVGGQRRADRDTRRDAYRPKRAAGRPAARTGRRPGARPASRRPSPGPRAVFGPHASERRRASSGMRTGAGGGADVDSAPRVFFTAVRAARAEIGMTGAIGAAGPIGASGAASASGGETL